MSTKITIDPITRIEGHLAIRTEIENGKVAAAYASGEMFRGFENILQGRAPLDAQQIVQRICGVCPIDHGMASVLAQEEIYKAAPPENGRIARNLIQAANFIASHITHFYLLSALDFIDVEAVLKYVGRDSALLGLQAWVKSELANRSVLPAAPFLPRYVGDYLADDPSNFTVLRHYLEALDMRKAAHQMAAIFAGRVPHAPGLVPGGITDKITALKVDSFRALLDRVRIFIDESYVPDMFTVAGAYPNYFAMGAGCGSFLSYGAFPEASGDRFFPSGALLDGQPQTLDIGKITEDVGSSHFSSASGLHPDSGQTAPAPDKAGAYSWLKSPRYGGAVVEVGPLARLLIARNDGKHPGITSQFDAAMSQLGLKPAHWISVMGRHLARAVECKNLADRCSEWLDQLAPGKPAFTDFQTPAAGRGCGLTEAARGALGHWVEIRNGIIHNYQCVVPTTWNCSPRDDRGAPGPLEQALVGTAVANEQNPIEIARVIRSFDPCLACAVH
jgi:ferredoxin hydrogenase large subunit/hydrogenase large subunit